MGLWRVLGSLPERFGVLREPCGACLGDHFGSKDGLRRFRFYRTLLVSVEAGRRPMLRDEKWKKSQGYDDPMAPGGPARAREFFSSRRPSWFATLWGMFEDHLRSKDGPRRFRFYWTLLVPVEAGRGRMLGDVKWNKFA